ncbi:MAG TPA: hypothetical protein VF519_18270 [Mycobacteriales bacterium]
MTTLDIPRGPALNALAAACVALGVFAVASRGGTIALAATAAAVLGMAAYLADQRTQAAVGAGIAAVVLLPIYWGRPLVGLAIVAVPATAAAMVLALPALRTLTAVRWGLLDLAYLGYVLFLAMAAYLNTTSGTGAAAGIVWRYAFPYVVWRALAPRAPRWVTVARILVATGTAMGIFALVERATSSNWYFTAAPVGYQRELAVSLTRFGGIRAEASFGEPITFGMFLGLCLVLALTLAVASGRRAERLLALPVVGVLASAILASGSRAALAVTGAGVAIQLLRFVNRAYLKRFFVVAAVAVFALLSTGFLDEVQGRLETLQGTRSREARSAQYRFQVVDVLTDTSQWTLLGQQPEEGAVGVGQLARENSGLKSLDNQYAFLLVTGGLLSLGAFLLVGILVFKEALTSKSRDIFERAVTSGIASLYVGFTVVALLTQLSDLFALLVALLAGARQTRRLRA